MSQITNKMRIAQMTLQALSSNFTTTTSTTSTTTTYTCEYNDFQLDRYEYTEDLYGRRRWTIKRGSIGGDDPGMLQITAENGKVNIQGGGQASDLDAEFKSKFHITGDFDIQIDFDKVLHSPAGSSVNYGPWLRVYNNDETKNITVGRYRTNVGNGFMYSGTSDSWDGHNLANASGKLRLTRTGSTIKGYYWDTSQSRWEWENNTNGKTFTTSWAGATKMMVGGQADVSDVIACNIWDLKFKNANALGTEFTTSTTTTTTTTTHTYTTTSTSTSNSSTSTTCTEAAYPIDLSITNHDFETGDTTGWTQDVGAGMSVHGNYKYKGSYGIMVGSGAGLNEVVQTIDLAADGVCPTDIDDYKLAVIVKAWYSTYSGDADMGNIGVAFLDAADAEMGRKYRNRMEHVSQPDWVHVKARFDIPRGCRKIKLLLWARRDDGTNCDAYFDEIVANVVLKPDPNVWRMPMKNSQFHLGNYTNWTTSVGGPPTIKVSTSYPEVRPYWTDFGDVDITEIYQEVDLRDFIKDFTDIDAGNKEMRFKFTYTTYNNVDPLRVTLQYLTKNGTSIAVAGSEHLYDITAPTWNDYSVAIKIPAGTRKVRAFARGTRTDGTEASGYFDNPDLRVQPLNYTETTSTSTTSTTTSANFNEDFEAQNFDKWDADSGASFESKACFFGNYNILIGNGGYLYKNITARNEYYVTFYWSPRWSSTSKLIEFKNGSTILMDCWWNLSTNVLEARRGGTTAVETDDTQISTHNDNPICSFYQVYCKIDDTVGRFVVIRDGDTLIDFTGDTKPGADTLINRIQFGGSGMYGYRLDNIKIRQSGYGETYSEWRPAAFTDGFESGDLSAWDYPYGGLSDSNVVAAGAGFKGSYQLDGGLSHRLYKDIAPNDEYYIDFLCKTRSGSNKPFSMFYGVWTLFSISVATGRMELHVGGDLKAVWDRDGYGSVENWQIHAKCHATNGFVRVYDKKRLVLSYDGDTTGGYTGARFDRIMLGESSHYIDEFDDMNMSQTGWPAGGAGLTTTTTSTTTTGTTTTSPVDDDFTGSDGNPARGTLWKYEGSSTVNDFDINSNRLRIRTDALTSEERKIRGKWRLIGDFKVRIDFDVTGYPSTDAWYFGLRFDDGSNVWNVERNCDDGTKQHVQIFTNLGGNRWLDFIYDDATGKIEFERKGSNFVVRYYDGTRWNRIMDDVCGTGNAQIRISTAAYDSNPNVTGYMDNFRLLEGEVTQTTTTTTTHFWDEDFSGMTTGNPPTAWTETWDTGPDTTVEAVGEDKSLSIDISSNAKIAVTADAISRADIEVLALIQAKDGFATLAGGVGARISGGPGTETGYVLFLDCAGDRILLRRYNNGTSTDLANHSHTIGDGYWYWLRLRLQSDVIKARVWDKYDSEPGTWDIDHTDTSPITAAGEAGVCTFNADAYCDHFLAESMAGDWPITQPTYVSTTTTSTTSQTTTTQQEWSTDFSEFAAGDMLGDDANWTRRWDLNADFRAYNSRRSIGGRRVLGFNDGSGGGRSPITWNEVPARANSEILFKVKWLEGAEWQARGYVRASGTGAADERAYFVEIDDGEDLSIGEYVAGSYNQIAQLAGSYATDTWYWIRFRANGTALKAKIWQEFTAEPGAWSLETTDSSITEGGWVGFGPNSLDNWFDYFSVAINGGTAPGPPSFTTTTTTTHTETTTTSCEMDEDFTGSDGVAAGAPWTFYGAGTETDFFDINSNRLRCRTGSLESQGARYLRNNYKMEGDFDIQVDFDATGTPSQNNWYIGLNAHVGGADAVIYRMYGNGHYYRTWIDGVGENHSYVDTTGKLRLVRIGSTYYFYRWTGTAWHELRRYSQYKTIPAKPGFTVTVWTSIPAASVYMDNFKINEVPGLGLPCGTYYLSTTTTSTTTTHTTTSASTTSTTTTEDGTWSTNFSEHAEDAVPSDWTEVWELPVAAITARNTEGQYGNRYLEINHSTYGHYFAQWDDVPAANGVDVLAKVKFGDANPVTGDDYFKIIVRQTGGNSDKNGYEIRLRPDDDDWMVYKWVSGVATQIGPTRFDTFGSYFYWVRFQVRGNALKAKVWVGQPSDEPGSWEFETTDSAHANVKGTVGVGSYNGSDTRVDYFAVGIGNDDAPAPADYLTTSTTTTTTTATTTTGTTESPMDPPWYTAIGTLQTAGGGN